MNPIYFIAREASQAIETQEYLSNIRVISHIFPTVEITYLKENLNKIDNNIHDFDGIIFTSINAVKSLDYLVEPIHKYGGKNHGGNIFAVGEKTAAALKEYGFKNVISPKIQENIAHLIKIIKQNSYQKLLYIAGKYRKDTLENSDLAPHLTTIKSYAIQPISALSDAQIILLKDCKNPHFICLSRRIFDITYDLIRPYEGLLDKICWHILSPTPLKKANRTKFYPDLPSLYEAIKIKN